MRLALVGGLPGTGKATLAQALAAATDAILLSTDHIRASLHVSGALTGESGRYGSGAYRPAAKAADQ